jgi:opacity protein-like surface antigen
VRKASVLFLGIFLSLALADAALAQPEKGQRELSFAAAFMAVNEEEGETNTAFNLSGRVGYYITNRFEFEPEMILSKYEDEDPGFVLSANFLYNVSSPGASSISPFLLAGVGWSNSLPFFNQMNFGDADRNYTVLNLGLGIKTFLSERSALRFGYRFQRFFAEEVVFPHPYSYRRTYDPSVSYHNLLFGLSVFLR